MPGRASCELVPFKQDSIHSLLSQVVQRGRSDGATTDDHNIGLGGQI